MRSTHLFEPLLRNNDLRCAKAAMGDAAAIQALAATTESVKTVLDHRLGPLLAADLYRQALPSQPDWHASRRSAMISRIIIEQALKDLGNTLDNQNIPWLPLKGMGPIAEYYPSPECRPTSDLDVLIPREKLEIARRTLVDAGWAPFDNEDFNPEAIYNWKALHQTGVMLELHYALWGGVTPHLAGHLLQNAAMAPDLGSSALRSPAPDLFIIAATHLWNSPVPRILLYFLDLHLLALSCSGNKLPVQPQHDFVASIIESARNHDIQLCVGLAASITNALWPNSATSTIAETLFRDLRISERSLLRFPRNTPSADLHLGIMTFSRLLSRRKTRSGWKAASRFIKKSLLPPK